jgi:hypothetical protein
MILFFGTDVGAQGEKSGGWSGRQSVDLLGNYFSGPFYSAGVSGTISSCRFFQDIM